MWKRFIMWVRAKRWRVIVAAVMLVLVFVVAGLIFVMEPEFYIYAFFYSIAAFALLVPPVSACRILKYSEGRAKSFAKILAVLWILPLAYIALMMMPLDFPQYNKVCEYTLWGSMTNTLSFLLFITLASFVTLIAFVFSRRLFQHTKARRALGAAFIALSLIFVALFLLEISSLRVKSQGKNARRIADIRNVQNALEVYFVRIGNYPDADSYTEMEKLIEDQLGSNLPHDPLCPDGVCENEDHSDYIYGISLDLESYALGGQLECGSSYNATENDIDGIVYGINCDDPVYCVQF